MAKRSPSGGKGDMMQGTLDMLVLKTLILGPAHGHTIAHAIERTFDEVLQVEHGSLYPSLHRLEEQSGAILLVALGPGPSALPEAPESGTPPPQ